MRLFAHASTSQPRPRAAIAAFLGGYALVWTSFATLAFLGDVAGHRALQANPSPHERAWLIGGAVLALAGAFQFTRS